MTQPTQLMKSQQVQKQSPIQENKVSSNTNKVIIFDSGTLISFSMNGIVDIVENLKSVFKGKFLITQEIKNEVIDRPVKIKKFKLEALKIKRLLDKGILEMPSSLGIKDSDISFKSKEIMGKANSMFVGNGRDIHLIDVGEASCLALSKMLSEKNIQNVLAVDERTTRMVGEDHEGLKRFLEKKLHVKIKINHEGIKSFTGFKFLRSTELIYVAYKKGLIKIKDENVLDALLWAVKFKGATISGEEIEEIKKLG